MGPGTEEQVCNLWSELPFASCDRAAGMMEGGGLHRKTTEVPLLVKGMKWEHYKEELRAWAICAEVVMDKRVMALQIAINLPLRHPLNLRERVFDKGEYGVDKLNAETGVDDLIKFLDNVFMKDPLSNRYDVWKQVTQFKRKKNQDVEAYIAAFEALFRKAESNKLIYPADIKGFMLMEGAELSTLQTQFVTNNCDFSCSNPVTDAPRLLNEIKAGLKKTAGQQSALLGGGGAAAALYTEHDLEVFLSTEKGKKLVKAAAGKKQRKKSSSEGDKSDKVFTCWYCNDPGHRKYDCPVFR